MFQPFLPLFMSLCAPVTPDRVCTHALVSYTCTFWWLKIHSSDGYKVGLNIASYPGRMGGERRPGIECSRMRGCFRYISVKL